jgi:hypothetical protein
MVNFIGMNVSYDQLVMDHLSFCSILLRLMEWLKDVVVVKEVIPNEVVLKEVIL